MQTGPTTFDVPGTFTIRGVSKPETLPLTVSGVGTGSGTIKGTMAFDVWNRLQDVWIAADGALFLHHANITQRDKLPRPEVVQSTLLEFAKLVSLLLCMLCLYAIFHTLFLSIEDPQPIFRHLRSFPTESLARSSSSRSRQQSLSSAQSSFAKPSRHPHPSLASTLPLQLFYWATSIMVTLFFLAWFLETHYIFSPIKHW